MQVHPDIAALRSDRAPQCEAQTAILLAGEASKADPAMAALHAELEVYGEGAPLETCPVLEAMFTEQGEAERLMQLLSGHYCRAIGENPFGHPPFRNGFDGMSTSILLARTGRAQLLLQSREPGTMDNPGYVFCDATRLDAVIGGTAEARLVRIVDRNEKAATFIEEPLSLKSGHRLAVDLSTETLAIDTVQTRVVILRLLRTAEEPQTGREYDAGTGRLLHQSAGRIGTSRREAIVALLGRMGRTDAAPDIARLAIEQGDLSLRWQAMREALSLDTALGFRALCIVARRGDDPLARQAGALRAQLLETYPALAQLEADQCPA